MMIGDVVLGKWWWHAEQMIFRCGRPSVVNGNIHEANLLCPAIPGVGVEFLSTNKNEMRQLAHAPRSCQLTVSIVCSFRGRFLAVFANNTTMTTTRDAAGVGSFPSGKEEIVRDLLRALDYLNHDEESSGDGGTGGYAGMQQVGSTSLFDVFLQSSDGVSVPANRFVLAARSPVLRKMLYGNFREAKSNSIDLSRYDSRILQCLVKYCTTNAIPFHRFVGDAATKDDVEPREAGVRGLVELCQAADFMELEGLHKLVARRLRTLMTTHLPMACVVFDEAAPSTELYATALHILETRPYMALEEEGSIESLSADRLLTLFKSPSVGAGELFLFRLLKRWYDNASHTDRDAALHVAHQACRSLHLVNIEPHILLDRQVQNCPFVTPELIFAAVAKQALKASEHRVWTLSGRGKGSVERLLVEGCGMRDAQGLYYLVVGLANGGGLYTKREVSCGQPWVYTLSCANKGGQYECRLFRSKLLTCGAVHNLALMQHQSTLDPVFQPVLQVLSFSAPSTEPGSDLVPTHIPTPIRKYYRARLSDGDYHLHATLSTSLTQTLLEESNEIGPCTLLKVLEYGLYSMDGCASIHVTKVSVVNSNPGQCFGDPQPIPKTDEALLSLVLDTCNPVVVHKNPVELLYSCSKPVDPRERDSPCPRSGWKTEEEHGMDPCPTVAWIPAATSTTTTTSSESTPATTRKAPSRTSSSMDDATAPAPASLLVGI